MGIVNSIVNRLAPAAAATAQDAAAAAVRQGAVKEAVEMAADRVVIGYRPRSAQVVKVRDEVLRFGREITLADVQAEQALMARVGVIGYQPRSLRGGDFRGQNLAGLDLSHFDLKGAKLQGADLSRTNLKLADLSNADLTGANLTGTNLSNAWLEKATLVGARLNRLAGDLKEAILDGAILGYRDGKPVELKSVWNFKRQAAKRKELARLADHKFEGHVTHAE
ncbi:MAG: pentapeptide repeat-containing protein [Candidatus Sericytochromatia bacterium]|nr:pentapeptide repeat-containing protein [Candidatus Sericytochromatia bacterium]